MTAYRIPIDQHEAVIRTALRVIQADHYARADDPYGDAESEYASESLALAARDLVEAVHVLPEDKRPVGWTKDAERAPVDSLVGEVARLKAELDEQRRGRDAFAREVREKLPQIRAKALLEAADFVGNDDTCTCRGCDTCVPRELAAGLRRMADGGERA